MTDPDRARRTEVSNGRRALYDEKRHLRGEDLAEEDAEVALSGIPPVFDLIPASTWARRRLWAGFDTRPRASHHFCASPTGVRSIISAW